MATGRRHKRFCERVLEHPKYTEYIKIHLEDLQSKCDHLTICINKLLSQQSPISVLKGDNLGLNKICNLIHFKDNSTQPMLDGKCSWNERMDIMQDVENHLKDKMEKRDNWDDVAICLENNYGDEERTTYIRDICGLVERDRPNHILCNYNTHKKVEKFINEQIEHLQCTCKALQRDTAHEHEDLSTAMVVGIGLGVFLLICIIFAVLFCCWRRRRNKRKKNRKPKIIYLPAANSDTCPVYQEIFDQRSPPLSPPALPSRYGSRPLPGHPAEEAEYLEPVQAQAAVGSYRAKAPPPLVNNRGYNFEAPPKYSETDQAYEEPVLVDPDADAANAYFEPIVTPKAETTQNYDTLNAEGNNDNVSSGPGDQYQPLEDVTTNNNNNDDNGDDDDDNASMPDEYQPLEDINIDKPLGPAPAERTKKEDRQTESEYFVLEKQETQI